MKITFFKNTVLLILLTVFACGSSSEKGEDFQRSKSAKSEITIQESKELRVGAELFERYAPLITNKNVAVVANPTSYLFTVDQHLVDFLLSKDINVTRVFAPEHGFRGTADAGEHVRDDIDTKTGLPLISLHGSTKKPKPEHLKDVEVVIFDIQDVGARFYTYISTLHYVMEACAEAGIPMLILDRPNPNGHYIDGPILEKQHQSFVGMHPIPIVHGMTIGEYAQMINGEKWLDNGITCELTVIPVANYTHNTPYSLPIKPSPNLPNDQSIQLYPSLCFFEGTPINAGRGTDMQFQIFGAPNLPQEKFQFSYTPRSNEGAKHPKFKGQLCYGKDLREYPTLNSINLEWVIEAYEASGKPSDFFTSFFTLLAGTTTLQHQIEQGESAQAIRDSWKSGLDTFEKTRAKYLIYP